MIFIPGLVFEGAYNTESYTFNKSKWQVLIMAGPGVVLTSVILAYSFVYVFGYSPFMSVSEGLIIG
jgi:NhaP-type Na+/H+ or K+/H+ antiporter